MKATSIRNWFIAGAILVLLGVLIPMTNYQLPSTFNGFTELENLLFIVESIGLYAGLVCIAIGLIALYKFKKKQQDGSSKTV